MYGLDTVIKDLEEIVDEKGANYRYPLDNPAYLTAGGGCLYRLANGKPACLIGHLLDRYDLLDYIGEGQVFDFGADVADMFTPDAVNFLGDVQMGQDLGLPWIEAVDNARAKIELANV